VNQQPLTKSELADLVESQAASLVAALRQPAGDGVRRPSVRLAAWTKVAEREGESYSWPEGVEHYLPFEVWESVDVDGPVQIGLGRVTVPRVFYGRERFWWLAFEMIGDEKGRPIVVYNEADAQRGTGGAKGDLVAVIKGKGHRGRSMFAPGDDLPDLYDDLPVDVFRNRISGPQAPNRLAVIASGGDRDVMLDHALFQLRLRS
jgi:hypothetical protein